MIRMETNSLRHLIEKQRKATSSGHYASSSQRHIAQQPSVVISDVGLCSESFRKQPFDRFHVQLPLTTTTTTLKDAVIKQSKDFKTQSNLSALYYYGNDGSAQHDSTEGNTSPSHKMSQQLDASPSLDYIKINRDAVALKSRGNSQQSAPLMLDFQRSRSDRRLLTSAPVEDAQTQPTLALQAPAARKASIGTSNLQVSKTGVVRKSLVYQQTASHR